MDENEIREIIFSNLSFASVRDVRILHILTVT